MTARPNNMAIPKLTYFDVRGRAEVIRLLLEHAGVAYTEHRVSLDEWPTLKSSLAFGQLPIYEEGDLWLNQSNAIYRYLGRKFDLYGESPLEQVACDIVQESFVDAQSSIGGLFWNPNFETVRAEYERTDLPALLSRLEKLFNSNSTNSGYWVGKRISYVDFMAWHFLDYVRAFSQKTLHQFEALSAFKKRIESLPRIAAYFNSERRPRTFTVSMCPFGGTPETS